MPSYKFAGLRAVTIASDAKIREGQEHRSSDNYDVRDLERSGRVQWTCPPGVVFDVKEDKTAATDPVTFRDVSNGSITDSPNDSASWGLYIADPKHTEGNPGGFEITLHHV